MLPRVCGYRVLIKPEKIKEVSEGGIVIYASEYEKKREQAGVYTGEIVSIGESAWYDYTHKNGKRVFENWAKVGDVVTYTKYGGRHVEIPGQKENYVVVDDSDVLKDDYVVVNDSDVLLVHGEEK